MRLSVRLGKNVRFRIGVASPFLQDVVCQRNKPFLVFMTDTDDRQRPVQDSCFHVLISRDHDMFLHLSVRHGKTVPAALEVIVAQDGTSHDRQVRVGAKEIMRELFDKVK